MNTEAFSDPHEVHRLLECLGANGEIAVPINCGLANPRTLPAIAELVGRGLIDHAGREAVITDVFRLTATGLALCEAGGIGCAIPAAEPEPAAAPVEWNGEGLNPATVRALAGGFFDTIRRISAAKPPSGDRVFEILQALAWAAGTVIAEFGESGPVTAWFTDAVIEQIEVVQENDAPDTLRQVTQ